MKVALLAGGLGTRMSEESEFRPKPMVEIGGKPALWHIMKTFAAYGHTDFVICGGYKVDVIRDYFLNYGARNLDFTITLGDRNSAVFHGSHDEFQWSVTVADTGRETPTGGRIAAVEKYLGEEPFFCTYGDGIANVNIAELLETHLNNKTWATVTLAKPRSRFGVVDIDESGRVTGFLEKPATENFVNIGYFVFSKEVFKFLDNSSVLEQRPLSDIANLGQLGSYEHTGFWRPMDTLSEAKALNELWSAGKAEWQVWEK